ncbi:hypothetical protein PC9H_009215 [Pleurotus ostreatus]|uniref:Uncharacterized protein n=1 Tax=Pleurotus ostreatus TaxID=5322 RepID=A0A8H6ZNM4_PLEOS|nr:uncharacterized protein PC9H_009215 [Pleurotus ostreatus]KAF7423917.1 hypothetical protein PC9H_009215 [Pleurotus ostreatus]
MHNSVTLLLARCFVFGGVIGITLVLIEAEGYAANVLANTEGAVISRIGLATSQLTVVSISAMAFSSTGSFLNSILFEIIWLAILSMLWLAAAALTSNRLLLLQQTLGADGCYALNGS